MAKFENVIRYAGLDNLTLMDQTNLKNIAETRFDKVSRLFKGKPIDIMIDIKLHEKLGKKKYSLKGKIEGATKIFSANSFGWDVKDVTHELMTKLENEAKKRLKIEDKKGWRSGFKNFLQKES